MKKYQSYMMNFSISKLRSYLGEEIIETLIEWSANQRILTKKMLIDMIECVKGTSIFKDSNFRKDLLLSMQPTEIYAIRDYCLTGKQKYINDLPELIDIISKKPWRANKVALHLAELWELDSDEFETETLEESVVDTVQPQGERFFELLDYQYYIKQRALYNLTSGNLQERMFIHMPTGTGKTKTSMHIIANYLQFHMKKEGLVIWVAHTTELLQQAYDTFLNVWHHLGDGECNAYRIWGSNDISDCSEQMNGIAFCGLSKLMSIFDTNPDLFMRLKKDCRLLVFDEAHKASAPKTKQVIESLMRMPEGFENRALIGLSATPGRTTETTFFNNQLANMFGNKLIYIDSQIINQINMGRHNALNAIAQKNIISYFQERGILSKISASQLEYGAAFSRQEIASLTRGLQDLGFDERDFSSKQLQIFAENKSRNRAIMQELRRLHNENIPTIVFACSVKHAQMLSAMLKMEGIDNSVVVGDMTPVARKKAIERFKDRNSSVNIIINYEVLTTGFDSKNIRCVFITRPTQSVVLYSQMLGRGLRGPLMGGNEECLLIDIDDNLSAFDNELAFVHFNDYWRV